MDGFNAVLGVHEKKGGRSLSQTSCNEFHSWLGSFSLTHLPIVGSLFTCSNERRGGGGNKIDMWLDPFLCNDQWISS